MGCVKIIRVIQLKKAMAWLIAAVLIIALAGAALLFGGGLLEWYYSTQASTALEEGRLDRAVEMFEKQLSLSPHDDSLTIRLAGLLAEQGIYSRAEYHLDNGIRQATDPLPLYIKLSEVYVMQDKLYDAQELLSGAKNTETLSKITSERPAPPQLSPPPGVYNELISVSVDVPEGSSCYITWADESEIPSVASDKYASPKKLEPGVTHFRAITVDSRGLVSAWVMGEYRLENVVFELSFADEGVEALVRAALEKPEGAIMSNEVGKVTELVGEEPARYETLDDLKLLPALAKVSLKASEGDCDLSVLPFLSSVKDLGLSGFSIDSVDLEVVGKMTWLKGLSLESNMISDFSALSELTQLETLDLGTNSVLDIAPVASMPLLRDFRIPQNAVQDLTPLSGLTSLETLLMSNNRIKTLDGISSLAKLKLLDISHNYVENTSALKTLASLTELRASSNSIESLEDFSALSSLAVLSLSSNAFGSISPLSSLAALETLDISSGAVTSLDGLGGCAKLQYLEASKNQIASVEPLRAHPALEELRVESNKLTTLLPLKDCPGLKKIYAFGNSLTDSVDSLPGITVFRN